MSPGDILRIVAMAAAWGGSFLFLRMAVPEFGPVPLIAIRVAISALLLLPFVLARPAWRREFRENIGSLCLLGLINAAIPFPLFAYATVFVTAGIAAILNATAPLFAALIAWLWLKERISATGIAGLLLGLGGVTWLAGGLPGADAATLLAMAGALCGACLYGVAANFLRRRLAGVNTWVTTAGSFGIAAAYLAPLAALQWPATEPSPRSWLAVLLLAVLCTSIPNVYYFRLVLKVGPARAMSVAFLIPAFGMLWGALILDEPVTLAMVGGCAVILTGTALVTGLIGPRHRSRVT